MRKNRVFCVCAKADLLPQHACMEDHTPGSSSGPKGIADTRERGNPISDEHMCSVWWRDYKTGLCFYRNIYLAVRNRDV